MKLTRRIAMLVLAALLAVGSLPQSAYAADPSASPVISSTETSNTYQSAVSRTGSINTIQIDMADTGNYQINEVARLTDGYLYLGFDNTTGNELVRKVDFDGNMLWQNKSFFDMAGTTQIRGAVEYAGRLFVVGYISQTGFICELNPVTGALIPGSTNTFTGRANGAVSGGNGYIYIAGSKGLYTYDIAANTVIWPFTVIYIYSIAYVPGLDSVIAVCMGDTSNKLVLYTGQVNGEFYNESEFFTPASTDYIWSVQYMNGYIYATGQDSAVGPNYYIRKFHVNGTQMGRKFIESSIGNTQNVDYRTYGLFSNAYSAYFDSSNYKIYFLSTCNYPNREGKPLATGLDTGTVNTPFNTLGIVEFYATAGDVSSEFDKISELLDLNLHSVRGLHRNSSGDMVLTGTTQQGNNTGDTTNRMFMLRTSLNNTTDTAPQVTAPKSIVSYINMTTSTGLVNDSNIASKMTFSDDRTANDKLAGSFKLFSSVPTGSAGTGDVYFSVTDQCGNKTIGKTTIVRKVQLTGLGINGPSSVVKTTSTMPTANYTVSFFPSNATDQGVTWSSSAPDVATIDPATGALTAVGFGSTTITAQSVTFPSVIASGTVKVKNLYDIEITPADDATNQPVSGNISVTFQEAMHTAAGMVWLNNIPIAASKSWSNGNKTFTIPYSGLNYNTTYTIMVSDFRDADLNIAPLNQNSSFTTMPADVPNAKAAAQNATYTAIMQADVTDENAVLSYVQGIAQTAIDNDTVTATVNTVSYTPAVAGNSADADGTNGSYSFTITVSKGGLSDVTSELTLTITATLFTGVTDVNAVAAAKAALVDGTVQVAYGATQEQKTQAVQTYVDGLLAAVSDAAGVSAVVSHDSGSSYSVALTKGSITDSKTLAITIEEAANPDIAIIAAAKSAAQNAVYAAMPQSLATHEDTVKTYIENTATAAVSNAAVTVTINKVSYAAAIAGDAADADGTNGTYVFTVTVEKGGLIDTTEQITLVISATQFTGVTDIDAVASAKAVLTDGTVYVPFSATQAQKTAAVQTYVNSLLSAVGDAAGVSAVVSYDCDSSYVVALSKGAVTDSQTLTMTVLEAEDPSIAVNAAVIAVQSAAYAAMPQADAVNEDAVRDYIEDIVVAAVSNPDVSVTINKVSYTEVVAGTPFSPDGVNGEYVFTATLSKQSASATTAQLTLTITAQKHAFAATVQGGTGSGSFTAGTVVNIAAGPAPSGKVFDKWTSTSGVVFANQQAAMTSFVMPANDVIVTAAYKTDRSDNEPTQTLVPRTITNPSSGVTVTGGELSQSAQLLVTPIAQQPEAVIPDNSPANIAIQEASEGGNLIAAYEVRISGGHEGELSLSFPVGDSYNGQAVTILHFVDGRVDTYTVAVVNGVATIVVDSLSPFVILRTGIMLPDAVIANPPKTGSALMHIGFTFAGISALGLGVLLKRKKG